MSIPQFHTAISTTTGGRTFSMASTFAENLSRDISDFNAAVRLSSRSEFGTQDDEFRIASVIYNRTLHAVNSSEVGGNSKNLGGDAKPLLAAVTSGLASELNSARYGSGNTTNVLRLVNMLNEEVITPGLTARQAQLSAATARANSALQSSIAPAPSVVTPMIGYAPGGDVDALLRQSGNARTAAEKGALLSRAIDSMIARLNAAPSAPTAPSGQLPPTLISAPGAAAPDGAAPQVPPAPVMRTLQGGQLMDAIRGANVGDMVTSRNGAFGLGGDGQISGNDKLRFTVPSGTTTRLGFDFGALQSGEQVIVDFFGDNGKLLGSRTVNGTDSGNASLSVDDLGAIKSAEIRRGNGGSAFTLAKATFETTLPPVSAPGATNQDLLAGIEPSRLSGVIQTVGLMNRAVTDSGMPLAQKFELQSQVSQFLGGLSSAMQDNSDQGFRLSAAEFSTTLASLGRIAQGFANALMDDEEKNPLLDALANQMRPLLV